MFGSAVKWASENKAYETCPPPPSHSIVPSITTGMHPGVISCLTLQVKRGAVSSGWLASQTNFLLDPKHRLLCLNRSSSSILLLFRHHYRNLCVLPATNESWHRRKARPISN